MYRTLGRKGLLSFSQLLSAATVLSNGAAVAVVLPPPRFLLVLSRPFLAWLGDPYPRHAEKSYGIKGVSQRSGIGVRRRCACACACVRVRAALDLVDVNDVRLILLRVRVDDAAAFTVRFYHQDTPDLLMIRRYPCIAAPVLLPAPVPARASSWARQNKTSHWHNETYQKHDVKQQHIC